MCKKILFRADSSSIIGIGHIMRDLVLASQYPNSNIVFATQELEGNLNSKILDEGCKVKILKSNDMDELIELVEKLEIEMVIIDHYEIDYEFEKDLKKKTEIKLMVLDDTYEKHYCDILLNHNISADKTKYKDLVPSFCELRCGGEYTLLREEFYKEKETKREKIYDVFIAMGGADTANLNIKILESLPKEFNVALVTTKANKNLEELKEYSKERENISLFINSNEVAKLMNQSRLAVVTPSVSVNEVLFLGVPFIAVKTADNQGDIYAYLQKKEFQVMNEFNKDELRKIITQSEVELINFINLTFDEKKIVLEWRNHPSIKKWMNSKEDIILDDHLAYIERLKDSDDRVYFLVKKQNEMIGVIDFTSIDTIDKKAYIGIYAKPKLYGMGSALMQEIIAYGFDKLKLKSLISEVFQENNKATSLYHKFGFQKIHQRDNIVVMELKNENR